MHERALSHSPLICFRNPKILTCTIRPTCLVSAFISCARRLKNTNHQGGHYFSLTLHCNSTCFCRQKWTRVVVVVVGCGRGVLSQMKCHSHISSGSFWCNRKKKKKAATDGPVELREQRHDTRAPHTWLLLPPPPPLPSAWILEDSQQRGHRRSPGSRLNTDTTARHNAPRPPSSRHT